MDADLAGRPRVLVVEDDPGLAFGLQMNLEIEGYEVLVEGDGLQALSVRESFRPDLVLLDLMLPGLDGIELLRRWRELDPSTRIIILSARVDEVDRLTGLRLGADDYVTKPFSLAELLARVGLQLRRREQQPGNQGVIWIGRASVDLGARTVTRGRRVTHLTPKEFALLSSLYKHRDSTVSKQVLLREVWGHRAAVVTNTVQVHIMSLRRKIEADSSNPEFIVTVSKTGYRLNTYPPSENAAD